MIVIEMVSGNGREEKDSTPYQADDAGRRIQKAGKFWVYEQAIGIHHYAIFNGFKGTMEVYRMVNRRYPPIQANARGHYPIPEIRVEPGLLYDTHTPALLPGYRSLYRMQADNALNPAPQTRPTELIQTER